jgi:hypothetical protein
VTGALAALGRAAEERLVAALGLGPAPLAPELERVEGRWKGAPVVLTARAWSGRSIAWARAVHVEGGALEIANLLALPRPALPLPILGADLVRMADRSALVAADLSPIVARGAERDAQLAAIARHAPLPRKLPSAGDLPLWARRVFSPHALFVRVPSGEETAVWPTLEGYVAALAELASASPPAAAGEHGAAQAAYLKAHREEDRFLALLARMFDRRLAGRVADELLFPRRWPP